MTNFIWRNINGEKKLYFHRFPYIVPYISTYLFFFYIDLSCFKTPLDGHQTGLNWSQRLCLVQVEFPAKVRLWSPVERSTVAHGDFRCDLRSLFSCRATSSTTKYSTRPLNYNKRSLKPRITTAGYKRDHSHVGIPNSCTPTLIKPTVYNTHIMF